MSYLKHATLKYATLLVLLTLGRAFAQSERPPGKTWLTDWLTRGHSLLTRVSGALLLGIGVFGWWTEVLPQFG